MNGELFSFAGVTGGYGATTVVRGVGGAVEAGEACCVLGRNGVGKTTLMRLLTGHLPLRSGTVRLDGRPLDGLAPDQRHRLGLVYCPQDRPVFDSLSVRDNLALMGPMDAGRHAPLLAAFPILEARMAQSAGTLSGGERKILSFVRGIAETGRLLLLDEPSEGVQQENVERMAGFLREAKAAGRALLVVEQNLSFAREIADRVIVMDRGEIVLAGAAADIDEDTLAAHMHV
ncbi:MAG: ATP-binding cassette domain-containing protein [Defluviicoccus sp.]|nr:ATP-binding cassette domain-containing protein [Defluviicoccus sp.]MDE0276521.1 ATP-binding cassette domain-containing protein [Defluviicoccus sp.]